MMHLFSLENLEQLWQHEDTRHSSALLNPRLCKRKALRLLKDTEVHTKTTLESDNKKTAHKFQSNYRLSRKTMQKFLGDKNLWYLQEKESSKDAYKPYINPKEGVSQIIFINGTLMYSRLNPGISIALLADKKQHYKEHINTYEQLCKPYAQNDFFDLLLKSMLFQSYWLEVQDTQQKNSLEVVHLIDSPSHGASQSKILNTIQPYLFLKVSSRAQLALQETHQMLEKKEPAHNISQDSDPELASLWINFGMDLYLEQGATCEHAQINTLAPSLLWTSRENTLLEKNAYYKQLTFSGSTYLCRRNHTVMLHGDGSTADLSGVHLCRYHHDQQNFVVHKGKATKSQQNYKALAYHSGDVIFDGKIHILKDAACADAKLSSKNLLLDQTARVITHPELVCACDNVKAAHGATVSEPSKEDLWYLCSRGILYTSAFSMIVFGFFTHMLMPWHDLKDHPLALLLQKELKAALQQKK